MKQVEELAALFVSQGARDYLGEAVTQAQHMLQAGVLAGNAGASDALVAASLLHDVGHFHGPLTGEDLMRGTDNRHEESGARYLRTWLGTAVSEPVRLHVAAKRYLCYREPDYLGALSSASKYTLSVQGGPMTESEALGFEDEEGFVDAICLRRFDDRAKDPTMAVPDFEYFVPLLEALASPGI